MHRLWLSKRILVTACSLALAFPFSIRGYSFDRFTMDIFRHELSGNTINLHYTLSDPKTYGIKEEAPSFGSFNRDSMKEELAYLKDCKDRLSRYLKWGLNEEDRFTAEILEWWLDGQILSETYYYYQEPLGPTLGIQAQLPVLLAEYPFRTEEDIETYLALLCTLPEYFEEIADFEKEKSEQGLFMTDEALDQILAQCRSLFPVSNSHFLAVTFKERLEQCGFLDSDRRISYEAENLKNLRRYVEPAYTKLCLALEDLRGTGTNPCGLYHTPDGIRYYEYLLSYSIGTDRSMAQIHRLLDEQMEDDYETILYALQQDTNLLDMDSESLAAESPETILTSLQEQIKDQFPQPREISWQVKEVPDSLSEFLSPAFYMTPAIDTPQQNTIYINPSYKPNRTELITTLAHEGYPGHLYQNCFENTKNYSPVRNLFYIGGYTEGWGLYSEFYAYDFLGFSKTQGEFLRAAASLNFAVCASLDLAIHGEGWTEADCAAYLSSFGITDETQIHELYLNILEEPSNYLKYYLGYLEICSLKESALAPSSNSVSGLSLLDFHTWFLEAGPAPFPLLQTQLDSQILKVSSQFPESLKQDIHLFSFKPVHDSLHHPPVEGCMSLIRRYPFLCQRKQNHPFVLGAAYT